MKLLISSQYLFLFLIKFLLVKAEEYDEEENTGNCTLTGKGRADPFPSLLKCYKYNNDACCLSVHDDYIDSYVKMILSTPCLRKYPLFEILMCFGCHPNENKYIDKKNKIIRICRGFAEDLWRSGDEDDVDLDKPSTVFDNCGFKVSKEVLGEALYNKTKDQNYIIPSRVFNNFSHFMQYIRIPFYENYNITLVDGTEGCYNNNPYINNKFFYLVYIFLFALLILL